jgi:hypothetical protein
MAERLTPRDRVWIGAALALLAISVGVGVRLFPRAFPEATVRFAIDRRESERRAISLLNQQASDLTLYTHAARFDFDEPTKVFLEREMGLARADSAFSGEIRLWRWAHRWFRPGLTEEYRVDFAVTGELAAFEHRIEEAAPGASLTADAAREVAAAFARTRAGLDLTRFSLVGSRTTARTQRTDHAFTWEQAGRRWAGAPLRVEVVVQGDRVGALRTYLDVPEAWSREYAALRSRNETTGAFASVAYALLLIGVAIAFVRRAPRRGLRWRTAFGFGLVALGLVFLSELNGLGAGLFDYDTHQTMGAFATAGAIAMITRCLGTAFFVFLLTAGGESVYRDALPEKIALGSFFTRRGLRTREFFLATIVGFALAAFFIAYQAVFYCIADAFGAWAPAEIPYDELLNTSLPWAVVLLIGFSPAVIEEFSARMFGVPALARLFRSRAAGVIVAAAIWGFSHASYPNQPFYIRGVEVGLAGVLVGVVMLRFGILATLVWHYTVDALYTAMLLLRSGNGYYVVTGALAAGALLLPLAYALVAYRLTRRFESPEGLRNCDLPPTIAPAPAAPEEVPVLSYAPLSARRWATLLLLGGLLVAAVHFVPAREWGRIGRMTLSARDARRIGQTELRALGAPVESLRTAVWAIARVDPEAYRFGAENAGLDRTRELIDRAVVPFGWGVRAFAPGRKEEWRVGLDPESGRVLGFEHRRADEAPGDTLSEPEARARAERYLAARGEDLTRWSLRDSRALPRPARRDWLFVWEAADSARRIGEGAVRTQVGVTGRDVSRATTFFEIPERWLRERATRGPLYAAHLALMAAVLLGGLLYAFKLLARESRPGPIRWKMGFAAAGAVAAVQLVALPLGWTARLAEYETSQPWNLFVLESALLQPFAVLLLAFILGVGFSLLTSLHPTIQPALHVKNRARYTRDAALAALLVLAAAAVLARMRVLLQSWVPGAFPEARLDLPPGIDGVWALPAALGSALLQAGVLGLLVGLVLFVVNLNGRRRPIGLALVLLATLAFVPTSARGAGEILAAWLFLLSVAVTGLALARHVLRGNVLAYALACLALGVAHTASALAAQPVTRGTAIVLIAVAGMAAITFLRVRADDRERLAN